ncbi:MAG: Hsp20/alpha crystallin family protein [Firmicutes bacterium]|nr:Hsp20/alpha crystallin family protein [Bacillota bacterium]HOB34756.1 Hsp20/alpha crystallin family protein [Bacillota bacterium]HPZ90512.1 Hsp20/alpha crystallin family protein [Bacillota bacterium]HQE02299.1 Hsp20/alpha crystallin family protein [Bacillota bacterium]
MRLIPHEWRHLDNWRREMERFVEPLFQSFNTPRVDLFETDSELVAVCEIPGIEKKEDIHVDVSDNVLIISGSVRRWGEVKDDAFHRRERYAGHFTRSVGLPMPVKGDEIKATYRNGLLEVRMPKAEQTATRRIDIEFH